MMPGDMLVVAFARRHGGGRHGASGKKGLG